MATDPPATPADQTGSTSTAVPKASRRAEKRKLKRKAKLQTPEGKRERAAKRAKRREERRLDHRLQLDMYAEAEAPAPSPCKWCQSGMHWSSQCPQKEYHEARMVAKAARRRAAAESREPQPEDAPEVGTDTTALFRRWFPGRETITLQDLGKMLGRLQMKGLVEGWAAGEKEEWNRAVIAAERREEGKIAAFVCRLRL